MFLALFRKYLGFWTQTAKHSEKALELIKARSSGKWGWIGHLFFANEENDGT
jgi:hypothetical protein